MATGCQRMGSPVKVRKHTTFCVCLNFTSAQCRKDNVVKLCTCTCTCTSVCIHAQNIKLYHQLSLFFVQTSMNVWRVRAVALSCVMTRFHLPSSPAAARLATYLTQMTSPVSMTPIVSKPCEQVSYHFCLICSTCDRLRHFDA